MVAWVQELCKQISSIHSIKMENRYLSSCLGHLLVGVFEDELPSLAQLFPGLGSFGEDSG